MYLPGPVENLRRLDRGAAWTVVGNILNFVPALLELILLRKFGLGIWGEFLAAQAIVLVAGRMACFGLEKGLLWYLPTLSKSKQGLRAPAFSAALLVLIIGAILAFLASTPFLSWILPRATELGMTKFVIFAIPFFAVSEVLIGALQGIQRFHYRPLLRELGVSLFLAPVALTLTYAFGMGPLSLGIGFLVGHILITGLSAYFWWHETRTSAGGTFWLTGALVKYSIPLWIRESVNSANQRVTLLILSHVATSTVVGAFGVITMVWQVCSLALRSFETPLVAVTAGIQKEEVREVYVKVVARVVALQIPIIVVIACAGGNILQLISPALGTGNDHLALMTLVFASFAGSAGWMAQQILAGLGHSQRLLLNSTAASVIGTTLVWLLVPRWGILGASGAQSVGVLLSAILGSWQILKYAGLPGYPPRYLDSILAGLAVTATGTWIWLVTQSGHAYSQWPAWLLGSVFLGGWAWLKKPWRSFQS